MDLFSAHTRKKLASEALRYDTRYTSDHTLLRATKHEPHLPLSPAAEQHRPLAGSHCAYPRKVGQTELNWVVQIIEEAKLTTKIDL